jgi:hypothetical protein
VVALGGLHDIGIHPLAALGVVLLYGRLVLERTDHPLDKAEGPGARCGAVGQRYIGASDGSEIIFMRDGPRKKNASIPVVQGGSASDYTIL